MKNLTGALVLSFSLLLTTACRSGDSSVREDASTPDATGTTQGALTGDGAAQDPGAKPAGTPESGGTAGPTGAGTPEPTGGATALSETERQAKEACLDKWLKSKKLDPYGNADGTMYAGGTPLFNEATGETKDRLEYVYARQPEAKKACASAGTSAPQQ